MWRVSILILMALSLALSAQAKSKKFNNYQTSQEVTKDQEAIEQGAAFSPAERNLIRAQLLGKQTIPPQQNHDSLPAGLQKNVTRGKALPPGWQKKVAPGQSLDYQIYRQGESLPDVILRRLPPQPVGVEIMRVENKIIRVISATRVILDAFDLIPSH